MILRRSLFCVLLAVTLAVASTARADDRGIRMDDRTARPTFEAVRLQVDPARTSYSGSVRIEIHVAATADSFQLNARHLQLASATLTGAKGAIPVTWTPAARERLTFHPAKPLAAGDYALEIAFHNDFDRKAAGLYKLESNGDAYAFTQFESCDARQAFPCWDEPEFKIPWQVTLTVPRGQLATSNTPIVSTAARDSFQEIAFEKTPPMPSYLVAFAVGPFETVDVPGVHVPCRILTVKGEKDLTGEAAKMVPPLLAKLEGYFGSPYPFKKLDFVAVPEYNFGAMENPGCITFLDRILLLDPKQITGQQRRRLAIDLAHEMSHMWFGDLVTMAWWDDLWLNESFAEWMGDRTADAVYPELDMPIHELDGTQDAYEIDDHMSTHAMRQPITDATNLDQLADPLAYEKGQAVLQMLEAWVGPENFRQGVIQYLHAHAWGNAQGSDLWTALGTASGNDLTAVLTSYLEQPGVPIVTVEPLAGHQVRLHQERFITHGETAPTQAQTWTIPVTLEFSDGAKVYTQRVLLKDATATVTLQPAIDPVWIHPNAHEFGYYHWTMAREPMAALTTKGAGQLDERERVGLVASAYTLVQGGIQHGDDFLRTLDAFRGDPSAHVVAAVVGGLQQARFTLVPQELRPQFASYLRRTLQPALDRLGMEPKAGEDADVSATRARLMSDLGVWGEDATLRQHGQELTQRYLKDPLSISPTLVDAALRLAATANDSSLYNECRRRFLSAKVPNDRALYLRAIGYFHSPALVDQTLQFALTGPLRPQETFGLFQGFDDDALSEKVWQWAQANYDALSARVPPMFRPYMVYYAGGCSQQRLDAAKVFFANPAHAPQGTAEELARLTDEETTCISMREREGPRVAKMLDELAASK